jgi:membrane associated rhomboid family serine protease
MRYATPPRLMWLGFILLVIGFLLPFLMVLRLLEPTLLLNFVAYFASLFGLISGVVGVVTYARTEKKNRDKP